MWDDIFPPSILEIVFVYAIYIMSKRIGLYDLTCLLCEQTAELFVVLYHEIFPDPQYEAKHLTGAELDNTLTRYHMYSQGWIKKEDL